MIGHAEGGSPVKLTSVRSTRRPAVAAALVALAVVAALVASGSAPARSTTKPANTSPPTISGQAQEGKTLTASPGTWSGTTPMTFSYQWRRCNKHGDNCSDIGHAGDQTYTVRGDDV